MAGAKVLKDREQSERRVPMEKVDHAGRIWHTETDLHDRQHGHCAVPTLDGQYRPPIDIPLKYLKKQDPKKPFQMRINFAQWKIDWHERMKDWKVQIALIAKDWHPKEAGHYIANPTPDMIAEAGPMAQPPLEFIEACEVGNKWALGIPREDGTYYPRPKWATDDLWEQYQSARNNGYWSADAESGVFQAPDPAKYADEDEEVPAGRTRGPGGKFAKSAA